MPEKKLQSYSGKRDPTEKNDDRTSPDDQGSDSWAADQNERGYYYDDAHGYEVYDPDSDEDELEGPTKKPDDEHPA